MRFSQVVFSVTLLVAVSALPVSGDDHGGLTGGGPRRREIVVRYVSFAIVQSRTR